VLAVVSLSGLAGVLWLTQGGGGSTHTSGRLSHPRTAHATRSAGPPSLEAGIEPWQLDAPISRETVLALGGQLRILGGLAQSGSSVGGVYSLDPATGTLRQTGSLAAAVHDGAGAILGTSSFVF
jgi:hypothetical protein